MALADTVKILADRLPCNLDGQVNKKANRATAPPLQVVSTGVEAYPSIHPELMVDESHLLDEASGYPCMQERMGNDNNLSHILLSEYAERLIENVLRIKVDITVALAGCMGVGDYPEI